MESCVRLEGIIVVVGLFLVGFGGFRLMCIWVCSSMVDSAVGKSRCLHAILHHHDRLRPHVRMEVGDGGLCFTWLDSWHLEG